MSIRIVVKVSLAYILACQGAFACGPFFPNAYFVFGNERDILNMPPASFSEEVKRLLAATPRDRAPRVGADEMREHSLDADAASLRGALTQSGAAASDVDRIVAAYQSLRASMQPTPEQREGNQPATAVDASALAAAIAEVPREFALYAEGAARYHLRDFDSAVAKWKELLALPEADRKHRSVWAAYMIGRAHSDTVDAAKHFELTRELAVGGFDDPLNLAGESVGWQAAIDLEAGNITAAIRRYAEPYLNPASPARRDDISLRQACGAAFASPETLRSVVNDEACRHIVSAYVVASAASNETVGAWMDAIVAAGLTGEAAHADLLAWTAYESGDFDRARAWLDTLSSPAPRGQWVRSKLLLRDGKIDEAVALLRGIVASAPSPEGWYFETDLSNPLDEFDSPEMSLQRFAGRELGVLLLGRKEYVESLDLLLRYGYWLDAAYVAERVLTTDELRGYVDAHIDDHYPGADPENDCRALLARRSAREGCWEDAIAYMSPDLQETSKRIAGTTSEARAGQGPDTTRSWSGWFLGATPKVTIDRPRAEKLRDAAALVREFGLDVMGTEVQPDWRVFGGNFELPGYYGSRARWEDPSTPKFSSSYEPIPEKLPDALAAVLTATEDELRRVRAHAPTPDKRFHYRYVAADLMWEASQMLPDNDVETMQALYAGGSYLKGRDPAAANRFYRAMVWRNLNMPYAQHADRLRWFPADAPK